MLNRSDRPEDLKNRIRGTHGHLSNAQCAEFLSEYENPRLQNVFFAHISRECNTSDLVRETSLAAIESRCARAVPVNPAVMLAPEAGFGF
jgi:phosphoribosyl 1,2-cyclic phosphodiesterase